MQIESTITAIISILAYGRMLYLICMCTHYSNYSGVASQWDASSLVPRPSRAFQYFRDHMGKGAVMANLIIQS